MKRALHDAVLRSRGLPVLGALYRGAYMAAAAGAARALCGVCGVESVLLHRGLTREGWEPGVSDIDLMLIARESADDAALLPPFSERLAALRRRLPLLGDLWLGRPSEVRAYERWGGLRAREDRPRWRLLAGRQPAAAAAAAQSEAKRRWLDPWQWAFVAHMELGRRLFRPGAELSRKREADALKLYLDSRRCADYILAGAAQEAPRPRSQAPRPRPGAPIAELWLDSALRLSAASRRALSEVAAAGEASVAVPQGRPPADLAPAPPVRAVVHDPPYHAYLLLDEGAKPDAYAAAAERARRWDGAEVPVVLEPSTWALLLQSAYLGAPLGVLGAGCRARPEAPADAPFAGWGARASGDLPVRVPLLPASLRRELAAEAASWMALWWRPLWAAPGWANRFVVYHLVTRAAGLRLALEGAADGPFEAWQLQLACVSSREPDLARPISRLRDALLEARPGALDDEDRRRLGDDALPALSALLGSLGPALGRLG